MMESNAKQEMPLNEEQRELLLTYFKACGNLYHIIPLAKVYQIVMEQNPDFCTEEQFIAFSEMPYPDDSWYYIMGEEELYEDASPSPPMQRKLIAEWMLEDLDDFDLMEDLQCGKPFYVPEKDALLKWADDAYYEDTPQIRAVQAFFANHMGKSTTEAKNLVDDLVGFMTICLDDVEVPFRSLAMIGFYFTREQAEAFLPLYVDLFNHFRHSFNRAHTPLEMEKKHLPFTAVPADPFYFGDPITVEQLLHQLDELPVRKKISQNAPCPCGSGKKYKRCCGQKYKV